MEINDDILNLVDTIKPYSEHELEYIEIKKVKSFIEQINEKFKYTEIGIEISDRRVDVWFRTKPHLDKMKEMAENIDHTDTEVHRRTVTFIDHETAESHTLGEVNIGFPRDIEIEEDEQEENDTEDGVEDKAVEKAA